MNKESFLRLDALDSLRGIAILSVMAIHVAQFAPVSAGLLPLLTINGDMGVELFYVLSALSLSMSLQARSDAGFLSIRDYFIRRFFRIAPMFWLVLLVSAIAFYHKVTFFSPNGIGMLEVLVTAFFLHGLHPEFVNAVIPGGWSVAIEVTFYLFLPLFFKFGKTLTALFVGLVISLMVYVYIGNVADLYWTQELPPNAQHLSVIYAWNMSFFAQLPVFIMGMIAYQLLGRRAISPVLLYVISLLGGIFMVFFYQDMGAGSIFRHLCWGGIFAIFVVGCCNKPIWLLDNRFFRAVGKVSYSAYLLHFIILIYLGRIFRHFDWQQEIKFLALYGSLLGVTYFVSLWTYHRIELPFMRLSHRFCEKRNKV